MSHNCDAFIGFRITLYYSLLLLIAWHDSLFYDLFILKIFSPFKPVLFFNFETLLDGLLPSSFSLQTLKKFFDSLFILFLQSLDKPSIFIFNLIEIERKLLYWFWYFWTNVIWRLQYFSKSWLNDNGCVWVMPFENNRTSLKSSSEWRY